MTTTVTVDGAVCEVPRPRLPPAPVDASVTKAVPLMQQFGHAPGLIEGWLAWYQPLLLAGVVPARTKELCRLAVARRTGCHMCRGGRFADPAGSGQAVPEELAQAVLDDDWSGVTPAERAALDYTVAYWDDFESVGDATVEAVCAAYGRDGFLEIAVAVAQFAGMGKLFHLLGVAAG